MVVGIYSLGGSRCNPIAKKWIFSDKQHTALLKYNDIVFLDFRCRGELPGMFNNNIGFKKKSYIIQFGFWKDKIYNRILLDLQIYKRYVYGQASSPTSPHSPLGSSTQWPRTRKKKMPLKLLKFLPQPWNQQILE